MIIEDLRADLSEAAEKKLKSVIEQSVEKKLQKEVKKITKKLTIKLIITGAAMAGAFLILNKSDKIVDFLVGTKESS